MLSDDARKEIEENQFALLMEWSNDFIGRKRTRHPRNHHPRGKSWDASTNSCHTNERTSTSSRHRPRFTGSQH
ncbi:Uncharacterized protein APZ42_009144 [Daphnia magna]|uniref:Uncharacterized protein n=1 Tax=Daphnia magna TaxID=35525 RepID=A0A164E6T4_9CRUS|nr:Uncharacterized protein APZ42_009144 [Daphnia magna]